MNEFKTIEKNIRDRKLELEAKVIEARRIMESLNHMIDVNLECLSEDEIKMYESDFAKIKLQAEVTRQKLDK